MTLKYKLPNFTNKPQQKTYKYFFEVEGEYYAAGEVEVPPERRTATESTWSKDNPTYVAEDVAEQFFDGGGWENTWPLKFKIWEEDGTYMGEFEVELSSEPVYYATKVKVPE